MIISIGFEILTKQSAADNYDLWCVVNGETLPSVSDLSQRSDVKYNVYSACHCTRIKYLVLAGVHCCPIQCAHTLPDDCTSLQISCMSIVENPILAQC